MSALVLLLRIIQALVTAATWVNDHRIWIAAGAIAVIASWIAYVLPRDADDEPATEDDAPAPGARLSEDEIRALEADFDWNATEATPTDAPPPADTNPA